jgi:hypothetical protein
MHFVSAAEKTTHRNTSSNHYNLQLHEKNKSVTPQKWPESTVLKKNNPKPSQESQSSKHNKSTKLSLMSHFNVETKNQISRTAQPGKRLLS